jgi:hypothetical protein
LRSKLSRIAAAIAKTLQSSNNLKKLFDEGWLDLVTTNLKVSFHRNKLLQGVLSAQAHIGVADVKPRSGGRSQNPIEQL